MHIPIAFFLFCSILGSKNKYTTHYAQELDAHVLRGYRKMTRRINSKIRQAA